jgi:hypothetical protein
VLGQPPGNVMTAGAVLGEPVIAEVNNGRNLRRIRAAAWASRIGIGLQDLSP